MTALVARIKARLERWKPYQAWQRFGTARGNLLAAGIAYFAFFSLFPAFALAAVVFGFLLQGRPDLLAAVGDSLNQMLPGFVQTEANPEGLIKLAPPETTTLSFAGGLAFATLVVSGLGWLGSLRDGIRAVLGVKASPGNALTDKLRDLGVLVLLGVAVLLSASMSSLVGGAMGWLADRLQLGGLSTFAVAAAGVVVTLAVDTRVMVVLLRLLSGVPLPWRDVRAGAIVGGVGMTLLKLVGAQLIAQATKNPLFGSIVVVVGLLFWLNIVARVILVGAAWAANDIDVALAELEGEQAEAADREAETPGVDGPAVGAGAGVGVAADDERARAVAGLPSFARRDQDRASIAAGAVLGASAAVAAGAVLRGVKAVGSAFRRR